MYIAAFAEQSARYDEDAEWEKVEKKPTPSASSILADFHDTGVDTYYEAPSGRKQGYYGSSSSIDRQEREIMETLEREEEFQRMEQQALQQRGVREQPSCKEKMRTWKSMEYLRPLNTVAVEIDIDAKVSRDVESLLESRPKLDIQSSKRFFDLEAEKLRMAKWSEEQERKRQVFWNFE